MTAPQSASEKAKSAELVAQLPCAEQVDLLAQALLREYMHRRGFTTTLRTFDQQNPRDDRTISSRAVMRQLLNIPVEGRPSRLTPQPAAPGSKKVVAPTYMEELCSYRLTKRDFAQTARKKAQLEAKAAQGDGGNGLSESEAAHLARWQRDRQLWEDPSDTEMTAWCEETEQHRIQREAAQTLIEEGPHLLEEEAARAEKKRRQKEKRREKEARRKEKKTKSKKNRSRSQDNTGGADDEDGAVHRAFADDPMAPPPQPGQRWAPPGVTEPSPSTSRRTSLDRPDDERGGTGMGMSAIATVQDKEDWTLSAMALNPILAAALSEVDAEEDGLRESSAGWTGGVLGAASKPHATASAGATAPLPGGSSLASIAGTGTAFHARPIGLTSREEITSAWRPQTTTTTTTVAAQPSASTSSASASSFAPSANSVGAATGTGAFTYNPSATRAPSALSRSSSSSSPPAVATSSILSHRSSASHTNPSSGFGGSGGGGGLGAAVRGDGERVAHASSGGGGGGQVRQGFGFRKDSGGDGGGAAAAATGTSRKDRRVKLLVD